MASRSYSFVKFPRILFQAPFNKLSSDAKLLYACVLDRLGYSEKNGLADESGQEYVIYTIKQICDTLGCQRDKAMRLLRHLEAIGLISRQKLGRNRPDRIYVHTAILERTPVREQKKQQQEHTTTRSRKSQNATTGGRKIENGEVAEYDPIKTRRNKTIYTQTQSIALTQDEIDRCRERIKEQINYDLLRLDYSASELDGVVEAITEANLSNVPSMTVGQIVYATAYVNDRYAQLTGDQVAYAIQSIKQQQQQGTYIRNRKAYLQATLFNAPLSFATYANQVGII